MAEISGNDSCSTDICNGDVSCDPPLATNVIASGIPAKVNIIKSTCFPVCRDDCDMNEESTDSKVLSFATLSGIIYLIKDANIKVFADLTMYVFQSEGDDDDRGLLGLEFHPEFQKNGIFYVYYTIKNNRGHPVDPPFIDPCNPGPFTWNNRNVNYDHINTLEEWRYLCKKSTTSDDVKCKVKFVKTLMSIPQPFADNNGRDTLSWNYCNNKLVLLTGDGGDLDPFNLSQQGNSLYGKIIEIDVCGFPTNEKVFSIPVSEYYQINNSRRRVMNIVAKGLRNPVSYGQVILNKRGKLVNYTGNNGFLMFNDVKVFSGCNRNFGWRYWDGAVPTQITEQCKGGPKGAEKYVVLFPEESACLADYDKPYLAILKQDEDREQELVGVRYFSGNSSCGELKDSLVTGLNISNGNNVMLAYGKLDASNLNKIMGVKYSCLDLLSKDFTLTAIGTSLNHKKLYVAVISTNQNTVESQIREIKF